jgi:choline dehydrogenase-like flavoprotein
VGCPVDAKQSMLVTTIPHALARGATLVTRVRAETLELARGSIGRLRCAALDPHGIERNGRTVTIAAKAFVLAAGAIGSPALLLRSALPDPHGLVGKRTFLHPVLVSAALMPQTIDAFAGAPQSVYCDHFLETPLDGPIGYKLEAPPVHPVLAAITLPNHGAVHASWMRDFPRMQVLIALLRDGFHPESPGGSVHLRSDGTPELDYPLTPYVWDGARRAFRTMAEIQFAAGATRVMPVHGGGAAFTRWTDARQAIDAFELAPLRTPVVSAHVMGGCPLGPDPRRAVVDESGRHHQVPNLFVADGSLFPTSIGANPQLSIYAVAARIADGLARELAPTKVRAAS